MNNLILPIALLIFVYNIGYSQASPTELSAEEIFEKVVQHHDPHGAWPEYKIIANQYAVMENTMFEESFTIDNAAKLFMQTNYWGDTIAVSGSKGDQFIFSINGEAITTEEAERMNKFFFSEHGVRMLREHHTSMFGHPMYLKAAGANLLPGVEKRKLFGAETLGITFSGLPNSYKYGGYNDGAITLYVDPEKEYKLHAIYFDNGWGKDQKGMLMLFQGEIEEGGIRVPSRLLYFNASDLSFRHHVNAIKSVKSLE